MLTSNVQLVAAFLYGWQILSLCTLPPYTSYFVSCQTFMQTLYEYELSLDAVATPNIYIGTYSHHHAVIAIENP